MRHRMIAVLCLFLLPGISASVSATPCDAALNICDDINDIANGWNAIADMLAEGGEIDDADAEQFAADVATMMEATIFIGKVLVEEGNDDEAELGANLLDVFADAGDLSEDEVSDYIVYILDDLVDALDAIVDYCDEVQ